MHLGLYSPRSQRPDLNAWNTSWQGAPPRKMTAWWQFATGTLISTWHGLTIVSEQMEVTPDGQGYSYLWRHAADPNGEWRFHTQLAELSSGGVGFAQGLRSFWAYWNAGVLKASKSTNPVPDTYEWDDGFDAKIYRDPTNIPWVRTVPTSAFDSAVMWIGGTTWEQDPSYQPYRTRP